MGEKEKGQRHYERRPSPPPNPRPVPSPPALAPIHGFSQWLYCLNLHACCPPASWTRPGMHDRNPIPLCDQRRRAGEEVGVGEKGKAAPFPSGLTPFHDPIRQPPRLIGGRGGSLPNTPPPPRAEMAETKGWFLRGGKVFVCFFVAPFFVAHPTKKMMCAWVMGLFFFFHSTPHPTPHTPTPYTVFRVIESPSLLVFFFFFFGV